MSDQKSKDQTIEKVATNLLKMQKHLNSELLKFNISKDSSPDSESLVRNQLDKCSNTLATLHLIRPAIYATCSICGRPSPRRTSLDGNGVLRIDYPCVYNDCKEVKGDS